MNVFNKAGRNSGHGSAITRIISTYTSYRYVAASSYRRHVSVHPTDTAQSWGIT